MENEIEAAVQLANAEFIKGFISGQLILCILIFMLLKIFLFRNYQETKRELHKRPERKLKINTHKYAINSIILSKLKYNCELHGGEGCDWINVMVAQVIAYIRADGQFIELLCSKIQGELETMSPANMFGPISITEFSLGDEFPEFKNARVTNDGILKIAIDFSFDDQVTLAVETMALINWPRKGMASLPISLGFTLQKFQGTVIIEFDSIDIEAKDDSNSPSFSVYISEDHLLDFGVSSLLGHRTKVKDLPKLTSVITAMLKKAFEKQLVYPSKQTIVIPNGRDIIKKL